MAKKKKKVFEEDEYNSLWVLYNASERGGQICAGQENDAWPSYEDVYKDFDPTGIVSECPNSYYSDMVNVNFNAKEATGKRAYLVWVRYGSGDTFSCTHGEHYLQGIYLKEKEAEKIAKSIQDGTYKGYKCWEGYFERFESVHVEGFTIDTKSTKRNYY